MFPIRDKYWKNTTDFMYHYLQKEEIIVAPVEFKECFEKNVMDYSMSHIVKDTISWIIVHKGLIEDIDYDLIEYANKYLIPVYANEVFIIFSNHKELDKVDNTSPHIQSYWEILRRYNQKRKNVGHIKKLRNAIIKDIDMVQYNNNNREYIYIGNCKVLTRTIFGHKMFLDTRDISITPHILLDGYWEMNVTNIITDIIKEGMNIVEVGTNIGYYSIVSASKIGKTGKIYAFEANPYIFEILHRNIDMNGFLDRTELINKVVMNRSGKVSFSMLKKHHGGSSIVKFSDRHLEKKREHVDINDIDAISLDEYFKNKNIKIDVIKIDAEGSEPYIFDGMKKLINDNPNIIIICEFNQYIISEAKTDPKKFLEKIEQYGFPLRFIDDKSDIVDISIEELLKKDMCELYLEKHKRSSMNIRISLNIKNNYLKSKEQSFVNIKDISLMSREKMETVCRSNCQNMYLGNKTVLCRVLNKFLLYADTEDVGIVPHLCLDGYWEPWITLALARLVQPGWHCIDIGANHGYYTILMADATGSSGDVLAIEPNPKLAEMLERTININGFQKYVKVLQKAISDTDANKVELVIPRGFGMNATIWRGATSNDDVVIVETSTLDNLTKDSTIDIIKIDAEGAEEAIWKGMGETLRRNRDITVIMELNCSRYSDPNAFLEDIQKEGFPLRYIDYDSIIKDMTIDKCISERIGEDWMLFLKRE